MCSPFVLCTVSALTLYIGELGAAGDVQNAQVAQAPSARELSAADLVRLPPLEVPDFDLAPSILIGMTPDDVEIIIGPPGGTREQPPATIWTYDGDGCVFEVFIYRDVNTNELRALGFAVNGADQSPEMRRQCFSTVRGRH